jgi:hypothetical protein
MFPLNFVKLDPDIINDRKNPTKREALRFKMLELLAPITIKVKIMAIGHLMG